MKSGQPWETFHHGLSTKREPLWSHPVIVVAMIAVGYGGREIIRAGAVAAVSGDCADRRAGSPQRGAPIQMECSEAEFRAEQSRCHFYRKKTALSQTGGFCRKRNRDRDAQVNT
jgi:hypothetical protein